MRFAFFVLAALSCSAANGAELKNGVALDKRHFSTPTGTMNFVTIGDWGQQNDDQAAVATQFGLKAGAITATYVISLGDNFYEDGVESDTDPLWQSIYSDVYTDPALSVPWYAILGNHDHHQGRGQGEIDYYLNKRDTRWIMPSYWYNQVMSFNSSSGPVTVEWVFIDTILLSGDYDDNRKVYKTNSVNGTLAETQLQWIESTLADSTADWLFVAGHYPVYSGGEHGNTDELDTDVLPLLEKYNVDAYFCGHDHTLQHMKSNNVNYWLSGNGAKRGQYSPIDQSLFGVIDPGFSSHTLNSTHISSEFVDLTGAVVYSNTQERNKKNKPTIILA